MTRRSVTTILLLVVIWMSASQAFAKVDQRVAKLFRESYLAEATKNYSTALALTKEILSKGHDTYVVRLRLGWLYYLNGRYQESVKEYSRAISMAKGAIEPKLGILLPLMAQRRWKDAIRIAREVLKQAPSNYAAQSRLAYCYYQLGRYRDAEGWYRKALTNFPSKVEMKAGLAWSLLKQSRPKEAKRLFEEVLQVAPDYESAKEGLRLIGQ